MKRRFIHPVPRLIAGARLGFGGASPLPQSVDLSAQCSPVVDQGQEGSCTANALAKVFEFTLRKEGRNPPPLSRQMIYWGERNVEGDIAVDAGAQPSDGISLLQSVGVCPEEMWPYTPDNFTTTPSPGAYAAAQQYRVDKAVRLTDQQDCLQCLASGYVFAVGIEVFDSFETENVALSGVIPMPAPGETSLGGHEVYVCGYDLASQMWKCVNSWGASWGKAGFFLLPFEYLASHAFDIWTIQSSLPVPKP